MKAFILALTLVYAGLAQAQTVDVKDATAGDEETTTIEIKKGKKAAEPKIENKWELQDGTADVEGESGKLEVIFEEPEAAKFVISPNTPIREIWISALSTSFKLGWNEGRAAFVHEKSAEDLHAVMTRVISQQLGTQVTV